MNLNETRDKIKNVKQMLTDMINANELTQAQAEMIAVVIVEGLVKNESIGGEYTPD